MTSEGKTMATPKKPADRKPASAPTTEEIALRAYEIFVARGGGPGHDLDDWLQAESELLREYAVRRAVRPN
jgi:hypothetical protein